MFEVVVRRELRPIVDALKGKKTGYGEAVRQLERDPCHVHSSPTGQGRSFAYRLSGPLGRKVCGIHLRHGHRLAFSMHHTHDDEHDGIVEILYVGTRDTRDRGNDFWEIVHDLFEVENPPTDHLRPPCCENGHPETSEEEVQDFMDGVQRLTRGR